MTAQSRQALTWTAAGQRQTQQLIQNIFLRELLRPSQDLWLASPWIGNVEILDDRAEGFRDLTGSQSGRGIHLLDLLELLSRRGTRVTVITRKTQENQEVLKGLQELQRKCPHLTYYQRDEIHLKGLLGDDYFLKGSMNWTYSGMNLNEEHLELVTASATVSETRIEFRETYPHGESSG